MNLRKNTVWGLCCMLLASFSMTSCLGDSVVYEYSSDATVHAFELDNVLGVNYKFTIDHGAGKIYNMDSLPVQSDTIIDRILIKTLSIMNYATVKSSDGLDSLLSISDSLDLRGTMEILPDGTPGKPFTFKVWAPDGIHTKEYQLSVRVHQQHADSLSWGERPVASGFTSMRGQQKAVILNDRILVYYDDQNTRVASASISNPADWAELTVSGLPADFDCSSVLVYNGKVYTTTAGGEIYYSDNGTVWVKHEGLSQQNVFGLLVAFPYLQSGPGYYNGIGGVSALLRAEDGSLCFARSDVDATSWKETGEKIPEGFPTDRLSSFLYQNNLGVNMALVTGNMAGEQIAVSDTSTVVWTTTDGLAWYPLHTESEFDCPKLKNPSVMYYGGQFYIFGSEFNGFYRSKDGLVWEEVKERFMFPVSIRGKASEYSTVVDENNFIWIMRDTPCEVWRGRLNELGFQVR